VILYSQRIRRTTTMKERRTPWKVPFGSMVRHACTIFLCLLIIATVFRKFFFLFSIDALVDFNIVFLIAGPILIIALAIFESRSSNSGSDPDSDSDDEDDRRRVNYGYGATHGHGNGSRAGRHERREKKPKFSTRLWIHTRFWFAFLGTVGVLALLGWFFALFNPFVSRLCLDYLQV